MKDQLELADLEVDIFKVCTLDKGFLINVISNLEPGYFQSNLLSKIFIIFKTYYKKFQQIPTQKIIEAQLLKSGETRDRISLYIDRIFNLNMKLDSSEVLYIKSEIETFTKHAKMKSAIFKAAELLDDGNFEEIVSEIKDALIINNTQHLGFDIFDVDARYESIRKNLENKFSSGFAKIDKVLMGGWTKKEIYAFQAPPGVGKSIWLVNCGFKALCNKLNVVHYSMEMSEDRLGMRYDAVASKIGFKDLIDSPDEIKKAYESVKNATKTHLKIREFPTSVASIYDIEAHLENLKLYEEFIPDMVIVDYGDIMKSTRNSANAYEEQGWIFRELRALAVKRDIIVLTATQSRRDALAADGSTKDVIGMDQVADSMEKNRILDVLFSVTQSRAEKTDGTIKLWVAKNRNGTANEELSFKINYKTLKISEMRLGKEVNSINDDEENNDEDDLNDLV